MSAFCDSPVIHKLSITAFVHIGMFHVWCVTTGPHTQTYIHMLARLEIISDSAKSKSNIITIFSILSDACHHVEQALVFVKQIDVNMLGRSAGQVMSHSLSNTDFSKCLIKSVKNSNTTLLLQIKFNLARTGQIMLHSLANTDFSKCLINSVQYHDTTFLQPYRCCVFYSCSLHWLRSSCSS